MRFIAKQVVGSVSLAAALLCADLVAQAPDQAQPDSNLIPSALWGQSHERVTDLVKGAVGIGEGGEQIVRAETILFGKQSAEAIYCFDSNQWLESVVFLIRQRAPDTPGGAAWSFLLASDYAKEARLHIVSSLTAIYGKPFDSGVSTVGSHCSWHMDKIYVKQWSLALSGGVSMRLRVRSNERGGSETARYYYSDFFKVDPAAWGEEAAMDVRWLMGPGDVRAVYPDLERDTGMEADPGQSYVARRFLEGDAEIRFTFYMGQLVDMRIDLYHPLPKGRDKAQIEADIKAQGEKSEAWGAVVRAILKAKYGEPIAAPDEAQLQGATAERGDQKVNLMEWRWRHGSTNIIYTRRHPGVQYLEYHYNGPLWQRMHNEKGLFWDERMRERTKPF